MNFEFKLAWTYFRARRKSLTRFTATLALAGIASGVASLIVAQALARGFRSEIQDKILSNTAHVTIFQTSGEEIFDWQEISETLQKIENVREVSPTSYESVLIVGEKGASYAVLRVVQDANFKSQNSDEIKVQVGAELAEKAGLKTGAEAEIIVPSSRSEFLPKTSRVVAGETFRTGLYDYDSTWIRVSPEDFAKLCGKTSFTPPILSIAVEDIYAADKTAEKIRASLSEDFKIIDWQEANRPLFAALSLEKKVALAIISLIIFIAALNITTTLALLVGERRLDIAVLRTCGARTRNLISIFLLEGLFLCLVGIFFGVVSGLGACFIANYFKLISLPDGVYSLSFVLLKPNTGDVLLIAAVAFLLGLLATVYPAWRASKIKPLEILRNQ